MDKSRDIRVIEHIIEYCDRIKEYVGEDIVSCESFAENRMCLDAVCLCVLQIGELSTVLSDEFKAKHEEIPWRQIKQVRNIIAHRYGTVDSELLWEIVVTDIPGLRQNCEAALVD